MANFDFLNNITCVEKEICRDYIVVSLDFTEEFYNYIFKKMLNSKHIKAVDIYVRYFPNTGEVQLGSSACVYPVDEEFSKAYKEFQKKYTDGFNAIILNSNDENALKDIVSAYLGKNAKREFETVNEELEDVFE